MDYLHHIPGRLRVRSSRLKKNPQQAHEVSTYVSAIPGVLSVDSNLLTGSLTIRFDEQTTSSEQVLAVLRQHGFSTPAPAIRRPTLGHPLAQRAVKKAAKAAAVYLLEKALEGSVVGLFAALL